MGGSVITEEQGDILGLLVRIFSIISSVLLILGIIAVVYLRQYRLPHFHLVLMLFCAFLPDMLQGAIVVDSWRANQIACTMLGFLDQASVVSSCLWFVSIAINLYRMVVLLDRFTNDMLPMFHLLVWTATGLLAFLPLTTDSYTNSGGAWCWIDSSTSVGQVWRFTTFYGPLLFYIGLVLVLYVLVFLALLRDRINVDQNLNRNHTRSAAYALLLFPLLFLIGWTPPIINRYYILATDDQIFGLYVAHVISVSLLPSGCVLLYARSSISKVIARIRDRTLSHSVFSSSSSSRHHQADLDAEPLREMV